MRGFILSFFQFSLIFLLSVTVPCPGQAADRPEFLYTLAVSFDLDSGSLTGTSKIRIPARRALTLECGPLHVTGSLLERKNQSPLSIRPDSHNRFLVPRADTEQTLLLSWTLAPDKKGKDGNRIGKDGIVLTGFWHPLADQDMSFELTARLPRAMTGISEGRVQVNRTRSATVLTATVPWPLRGLNLAAGPYRVRSRKVGQTLLSTYFFAEDDHLADGYLEDAAAYIRRYEQLLGPFPFPTYAIVENRLPTGYGMPGFTLLGQAVLRLPFIRKTSLGHEILHSWFGNSVNIAPDSGNWCEGLTTYLADQTYAADQGQGWQYRKNQILRYLAYAHGPDVPALADFRGSADSTPLARLNRAVGYDRGALVFHMLRKETGDKTFFAGLRELAQTRQHQRAGWSDIEAIFSRLAGRDLKPFFSQWLNRTDIPRLSVQQVSIDQDKGRSRIRFHLVQDNGEPFLLRVRIRVQTLDGAVDKTVEITQADQEVTLDTDTLPTSLVMDPDYDLLRQLTPAETPPLLVRFLGAESRTMILPDDDTASRYQALADLLGKQGITVKSAAEVKNSDLAQGSFLLAGDSSLREEILAGRSRHEPGFHLQVLDNPLASGQVMVLVDASSASETRAVLHRLLHYLRYSTLDFQAGRIQKKTIASSERGYRLELLSPPQGMPVQAVRSFTEIIDDIATSRVIYVGETHTNYGDHILQLQVIQALLPRIKSGGLAIGMEMFPRSAQPVLDRYSDGSISDEKTFIKESGYFSSWGFDFRLYRGILGFAARHHLPIVGLNLDKKIVSQVFRSGSLDDLTSEQRQAMAASRDLAVAGYRQRLTRVFGQHDQSPHGPGFTGFIQAQGIWDETMAETIVNYLTDHPEAKMVVIAGTGHVYKDSAIPLRVARRMPGIRQSVLMSVTGRDAGTETGKQVDFLVFAPPLELEPAPKIGVSLVEEKDEDGRQQVRITEISPHGHGKEAGLEKGDVIRAIDSTPVTEVADLKIALMDHQAGDTVTLTIFRHHTLLPDETLEIPVQLSALNPAAMPLPPGHPRR